MKACYSDLVERLGDPRWWDENGVPRYAEFSPDQVANPYARQAALVQFACPRCRALVVCAVSSPEIDLDIQTDLSVRRGALYGLLPHFKHCKEIAVGDLVGVKEVWRRRDLLVWRRVFSGAGG